MKTEPKNIHPNPGISMATVIIDKCGYLTPYQDWDIFFKYPDHWTRRLELIKPEL